MKQLPKNNHYYWVSTSNNRTIRSNELALIGAKFGLSGVSYLNVNMALEAAKENARDNDLIIISGSTFIIADLQL